MPRTAVRPSRRTWPRMAALALVGLVVAACAGPPAGPVTLRLQVSLTPFWDGFAMSAWRVR